MFSFDLDLIVCVVVVQNSQMQGLIVSHSEVDLLAIRAAYKKETGRSLYTTIQVSLLVVVCV